MRWTVTTHAVAGLVGVALAVGLGAARQPPRPDTDDPEVLRQWAEKTTAFIDAKARIDATNAKMLTDIEAAQGNAYGNRLGRFQFCIHPVAGRHVYLLDSVTGNTWIMTQRKDEGTMIWQRVEREP